MGNLNVVPAEIQRMPCTSGLGAGDRVQALRQLMVVQKGTHGTVVGPSCARSSRVATRFDAVDESGEDVVLHVEPEDLRVLHALGEDVDDTGLEGDGEDMTEDPGRQAVAGGYERGDAVAATKDLCVSGHDPTGRVTVTFAWREDGKTNNLNVVPSEIRRVDPGHVTRGDLCAICLGELFSEGDGEDMCRMPCGHVLHAGCVRAYLNHQTAGSSNSASSVGPGATAALLAPLKPAQCPVCRRDMLP